MDLKEGLYLNHEILAYSKNWLIVYDGMYNYMLFNISVKGVLTGFRRKQMPYNTHDTKHTEYYTTFDNALDNLVKVVVNKKFLC